MDTIDIYSTSETRSSNRVAAPVGTTALIKKTGYLETLYVQDICVDGILANGYISEVRYPVNTSIKGILLNIPPCELNSSNRITLLINEGRVVHYLIDQISKTVCYGIEFKDERPYVYKMLESIVRQYRRVPEIIDSR